MTKSMQFDMFADAGVREAEPAIRDRSTEVTPVLQVPFGPPEPFWRVSHPYLWDQPYFIPQSAIMGVAESTEPDRCYLKLPDKRTILVGVSIKKVKEAMPWLV